MEIPANLKKNIVNAWPTIYRIINGFFSFIFIESKKIAIDVLNEIFGRSS